MVERKTKLIIFWSIIILIGSIVLIKTDLLEFGKPFTFFPGEQDIGRVIPTKTAYNEGDILKLRMTENLQITGTAIWIDGKKYGCEGTASSSCFTPTGSSPEQLDYCVKEAKCPFRESCPHCPIIGLRSVWGFDFGSPELSQQLISGKHLVEGWASGYCPPFTACSGVQHFTFSGITPVNYFFRFTINVVPEPCKIDAGQYLATMDFGPGSIYDTNNLPKFVRLCSSSPTMVVNKRTLEIDPDYTIKTKLENNQKVIVSSDKIYKQFWVSSNPLAECTEEGLVYYENLNRCLSPGTITYCDVGEWIDGGCAVKLITQCEKNEDCQIPCAGMRTSCVAKDEFTKVCKYEGECDIQERIIYKTKEKIVYVEKTFSEYLKDLFEDILDKIKDFFGG